MRKLHSITLLGLVVLLSACDKNAAAGGSLIPSRQETVDVTIDDIKAQWSQDGAATMFKYKGKELRVTAAVVAKYPTGESLELVLQSAGSVETIKAYPSEAAAAGLANMPQGQIVTIICQSLFADPMFGKAAFRECAL